MKIIFQLVILITIAALSVATNISELNTNVGVTPNICWSIPYCFYGPFDNSDPGNPVCRYNTAQIPTTQCVTDIVNNVTAQFLHINANINILAKELSMISYQVFNNSGEIVNNKQSVQLKQNIIDKNVDLTFYGFISTMSVTIIIFVNVVILDMYLIHAYKKHKKAQQEYELENLEDSMDDIKLNNKHHNKPTTITVSDEAHHNDRVSLRREEEKRKV